jgi:AraC-like DNA-binding protein
MTRSDGSAATSFRTDDLDEAHAFMSAAYMELQVREAVPRPGLALSTVFAHLGPVALSRARYRARARMVPLPFDDPCFVHLDSGSYRLVGAGEDYAPPIGGAFLLRPHERLDLQVDDFRLATVTLPCGLVQDVAHAQAGLPEGVRVRFESARPISEPLGRHWISTVAHVQRAILTHPELAGNPLIAGQAQRLLAAAALTAFPNTALRLDSQAPGEVGRAAVRRAVDFIDANPARDVSATEIAAAARLAVPALLRAFRMYLGTTPMAYLRRTRLELAHRDLGAGDVEQLSVIEVARRWGFHDPRRFATEYRRAYGRSPSETLRS